MTEFSNFSNIEGRKSDVYMFKCLKDTSFVEKEPYILKKIISLFLDHSF